MLMLTHRLQVLLDDGRRQRLEHEAKKRSVPVAVLIREAIDALYPATSDERRDAASAILAAAPMPVPDVEALRDELAELRERRA